MAATIHGNSSAEELNVFLTGLQMMADRASLQIVVIPKEVFFRKAENRRCHYSEDPDDVRPYELASNVAYVGRQSGTLMMAANAPNPVWEQCHKVKLVHEAREEMYLRARACLWQDCPKYGEMCNLQQLEVHNAQHWDEVGSRCEWQGCKREFPGSEALLEHLQEDHDFRARQNAPQAFFSHKCAEWCFSEIEWMKHCQNHLQNLPRCCGHYLWEGLVIAAAHCPFCLGDQDVAAPFRFQQFVCPKKPKHISSDTSRRSSVQGGNADIQFATRSLTRWMLCTITWLGRTICDWELRLWFSTGKFFSFRGAGWTHLDPTWFVHCRIDVFM